MATKVDFYTSGRPQNTAISVVGNGSTSKKLVERERREGVTHGADGDGDLHRLLPIIESTGARWSRGSVPAFQS